MSVRFLRRVAVVIASSAALATALPAGAVTSSAAPLVRAPSPAPDFQLQATLAARWQASQLSTGRIYNDQFKFDDWGLTIDTGLMLSVAGAQPARLTRLEQEVRQNYYRAYAAGGSAAGALAKTLVFAGVVSADVQTFGSRNVRAEVIGHVEGDDAGPEQGRISDSAKKDYSNVLTQSYGVIGLAATGRAPQRVVNYLLRQRCPAGYFRLAEVMGETCGQSGDSPDVDATALALKALQSARQDGASVPRETISETVGWLVSQQYKSGAFGSEQLGPNTNSTGLVANALVGTDRMEERLRAAEYVARMQIDAANSAGGPASGEVGAIAYNREALTSALANGIGKADRDQFRRATAQAYYALAAAPLTETAGYCPTDSGVTVVVDFRSLGGDVDVRCASAPVTTGLNALQRAGFSVDLVTTSAEAFVCRIQDEPPAQEEDCQGTPPQSAYWSYWNAPNGGTWEYSTSGAGSRQATAGGFEGWSFSSSEDRPPGVAATRPEPTTTPSSATASSPAQGTARPSNDSPSNPGPDDDSAAPSAGSALPTVLGVSLIALLAAGAGLIAWRRSRRA